MAHSIRLVAGVDATLATAPVGAARRALSFWVQDEKLSPQAQECFTFGLLNLNPAPIRPST